MFKYCNFVGRSLQSAGSYLDSIGIKIRHDVVTPPQVCKHRRLLIVDGKKPHIKQGAWIAPSASVIGDVNVGIFSVIWYGAVLRGDSQNIKIGALSSIGERCVIQNSFKTKALKSDSTIVGNRVTIEYGSILSSCKIGDHSKIEAGSILSDGVVVEKNAVVGSGSLVLPGVTIPEGELWSGKPAQFERKLTVDEISDLSTHTEKYFELATFHAREWDKSGEARSMEDEFRRNLDYRREPKHYYELQSFPDIPWRTRITH